SRLFSLALALRFRERPLLALHLIGVDVVVRDRDLVLGFGRDLAFLRHRRGSGRFGLAADRFGFAPAALVFLRALLFLLAHAPRFVGEPPFLLLGALALLGLLLFFRLALGSLARPLGRRSRLGLAVLLLLGLAFFLFAVGEVREIGEKGIGEAFRRRGRRWRRHCGGGPGGGCRRVDERLLLGASPLDFGTLALALRRETLLFVLELASGALGFFLGLALGLLARLALGFQTLAQLLGLALRLVFGFLARALRFLARLALGLDLRFCFGFGFRLGLGRRAHRRFARRVDVRFGVR